MDKSVSVSGVYFEEQKIHLVQIYVSNVLKFSATLLCMYLTHKRGAGCSPYFSASRYEVAITYHNNFWILNFLGFNHD